MTKTSSQHTTRATFTKLSRGPGDVVMPQSCDCADAQARVRIRAPNQLPHPLPPPNKYVVYGEKGLASSQCHNGHSFWHKSVCIADDHMTATRVRLSYNRLPSIEYASASVLVEIGAQVFEHLTAR